MRIEADENLPEKLNHVIDSQIEFLKMEFEKIGEISDNEIDKSKTREIATTEENIKHNRYRDMGMHYLNVQVF